MSLDSMRGTNSRLVNHDFSRFNSPIEAKLDYDQQISAAWDKVRELSNMAEATEAEEDVRAVNVARLKAIALGRTWVDYVKQCDRHFGNRFSVAFFSVVATLIASRQDLPDDLFLLKQSAIKFRNGREAESGKVFNTMQFNNLGHYLRFVDLAVESSEALQMLPEYVAFMTKFEKKEK